MHFLTIFAKINEEIETIWSESKRSSVIIVIFSGTFCIKVRTDISVETHRIFSGAFTEDLEKITEEIEGLV